MAVHRHCIKQVIVVILLVVPFSVTCSAYSVLTHEALIDVNWENVILPLLKQKYPHSSKEALKEAHAYAYGGAVVPDMGYYPFGCKLFTNLIHYVRSGDFVEAVLNEAHTLDEYAFALGLLCHYNADVYGHSIGINVSVPVIYPKMKRRFGDTVTYAENHVSHLRTEFCFDVLQTARGNYASAAYHDFIGFKVADTLMETAFFATYGLSADELFGNLSKAIGRFRFITMNFFPLITKAAWANKQGEIKKAQPTATSRSFIYRMHRRNDKHQFGRSDKPDFFDYVFVVFIKILPKIGPLKVLKYKDPGPNAEKKFIASFDTVTLHYARRVAILRKHDVGLNNVDFDTGIPTSEGEYTLADKTYCDWLLKLKEKNFQTVTPSLKQSMLAFYATREKTGDDKRNLKIAQALAQLKTTKPADSFPLTRSVQKQSL